MPLTSALLGFAVVAGLMTITPGLDTALVLRTALTASRRVAFAAALGVAGGCLLWGIAAEVGVSALLTASETVFAIVKTVGALYMIWLGIGMLRAAVRRTPTHDDPGRVALTPRAAFRQGFLTNLLNPKVGAFYVAILPQFLSPDAPAAAVGLLLAGVHGIEGLAWFALLILGAGWLAPWLRRPRVQRGVDGVAGLVVIGFGVRLALSRA